MSMQHCEAPIVDGRCPFDRDALPDPGPTPATHFALSTAPDAATALLLPFAEHPWHSRVVTALRQDAAIATTDDEPLFVLVSLPERLRPAVRDALAKLLDIRAHDRRVHCGISCDLPSEYSAVLNAAFPHVSRQVPINGRDWTCTLRTSDSDTDSDANSDANSEQSPAAVRPTVANINTCTPEDVAAVCQLCRAAEFLQCFTITDAACEWLGGWLENVTRTERHPAFIRLALQSLCDADMGRPFRAVAEKIDPSSFTFARHPKLDPTFLSAMLSAECSFMYIGSLPDGISDDVLNYIPPCALPRRVIETQLPCWPKCKSTLQCSIDIYHGRVEPSLNRNEKYILYVGSATRIRNRKHGTLCFSTWDLLRPFLPYKADGVVLPLGIPDYEPVFGSTLFLTTSSITFPSDFRDEHWGTLVERQCTSALELDLSQTQITTIGCNVFFGWSELVCVHLPPTLKTIHAGAFSCCGALREVTGLHRGVTIDSTAFAFTYDLPVSTFTDLPDLPAAPSDTCTAATVAQSARKKRPRNH